MVNPPILNSVYLIYAGILLWVVSGAIVGFIIGRSKGRALLGAGLGAALNIVGWAIMALELFRKHHCYYCKRDYAWAHETCPHCGGHTVLPKLPADSPILKLLETEEGRKLNPDELLRNPEFQADPVVVIIRDHADISEAAEVLRFAAKADLFKPDEVWAGRMRTFLGKAVPDHFRIEDEAVFPPLKGMVPSEDFRKTLDELSHDHQDMLKTIQELAPLLEQAMAMGESRLEEFLARYGSFIQAFAAHAAKEDEKVFPVLKTMRAIFD
ncbi:MAG: hemerythrin domain-containing protein [Elusimicrobia bacterium]|nr:hemerythrin domain-containing protein [Elusimicrobiota bacterium]